MRRRGLSTLCATCLLVALVQSVGLTGCVEPRIPSLQPTIRIASANLQDFGYGGKDCRAAELDAIAAILTQYDVVSCQEVMRANENGQECFACAGEACHIERLVEAMGRASGRRWEYRWTRNALPYGTRYEYYVILYDAVTVSFTGGEGDAEDVRGSPTFDVRPPFWASFRSGSFDFVVIDYHAPDPGGSVSTAAELAKLVPFLEALRLTLDGESDLLLAADLNSAGPPLPVGWSSSCHAELDYVASDAAFTTQHEWTGECGVDTGLQDAGLSDHPIVWAEFSAPELDDD